jgi:hypothetical protein
MLITTHILHLLLPLCLLCFPACLVFLLLVTALLCSYNPSRSYISTMGHGPNFPVGTGNPGWNRSNRRAALAEHAAGGRTRSPSGLLRSARDLHIIFQLFEIYNLVGAYLGRPISSGKCRIQTRLGQYRPVCLLFIRPYCPVAQVMQSGLDAFSNHRIRPPLSTFLARCNLECHYTASGTRALRSLPHTSRTPLRGSREPARRRPKRRLGSN